MKRKDRQMVLRTQTLVHSKGESADCRDSLQNGRKIFASCTSDKGLITGI
jgi:hypothetical protein